MIDYKIIILFVVLIVVIFILIKEVTNVKNDLDLTRKNICENYEKTKYILNSYSRDIDNKFKIGMNNTVERIRMINGDYMVQIRRMNELGGELIVENSNNYSESESLKKSNKMLYLSDENKNFNITYPTEVKKDEQSESSKSNDEVKSNKSEKSNKSNKSNKSEKSEKENEKESEKESEIKSNKSDKKIDEIESVITSDINITLETLQNIDDYSVSFLKKICKNIKLPISCKQSDNKWHLYSKQELYNNIKNHLEK